MLDQNVDLSNVDQVPSNAHLSEKESQLYISEDNEAVTKMIIRGRSPTMRHVSRTHRVALDWLFDRINLDRKYVESKNQLADILTKGSFTRDEWHNLLHLLTSRTTTHFPAVILFFPQESNLRCRKDLRNALRLDRQQRKQEHVVSFHVKAHLRDKITRATQKAWGVQETLK